MRALPCLVAWCKDQDKQESDHGTQQGTEQEIPRSTEPPAGGVFSHQQAEDYNEHQPYEQTDQFFHGFPLMSQTRRSALR